MTPKNKAVGGVSLLAHDFIVFILSPVKLTVGLQCCMRM